MTAPAGANGNTLLEIRGLGRDFGGLRAVHNVEAAVEWGRIQAVIGPNGAGKTTLFNLISGELAPTRGGLFFRDRPIHGLPAHRIAQLGIARTFQTMRLFHNMSVLENVLVGRHLKGRCGMIATALRLPGVRREERELRRRSLEFLASAGLEAKADQAVAQLDFYEQRLLEIIRALATEPALLLLDEPAAGLNIAETERMARFIQQLNAAGVTIMLVEHDMSLVMDISDTILVLDHGEMIASGPPDAIQRDERVIAAYLGEDADA